MSTRRKRARELKASELRWICRPRDHSLTAPERGSSVIGIIGQERAIRALKMGIELYGPGYNVFVCGITGTGRASTVQKILNHIKGYCALPPDRCYVHNFDKSDEPRLLSLPRGMGHRLRSDMAGFVQRLPAEVSQLLESEHHSRKKEKIIGRFTTEGDKLIERFQTRARKAGFELRRLQEGPMTRPELFPVIQGEAHPISDLEKLASEGKLKPGQARKLLTAYQELRQELEQTARKSRDLLVRMDAELADLDRKEVSALVKDATDAIARAYPRGEGFTVARYLEAVHQAIVTHFHVFKSPQEPAEGSADEPRGERADGQTARKRLLEMLQVNLIFDSRRQGDCPVVVETHPTYRRLFGYFEKTVDASGHWSTDYTRIRPGSLLAADGGYLVITAEDLFSQREVWTELKRTLISRTLSVIDEQAGTLPTITMKPEAIPLNLKVILIGHRGSYETLVTHEPEFRKIFKVLANFDEEMDLNSKTLRQYASFIRGICKEEGLAPFAASGVAAVAEFGARRAGHQGKLSTRFGEIADILREADYWRRQNGPGKRVVAAHVRQAIKESSLRRDLPERKIREMVRMGQIFIDVAGERVGQINGLVVEQAGEYVFGLPVRITATVSPGTAGIINIESEAMLSGESHTKGVLIIAGFLRERFGRNKPVTATASIAFEQSYGGVDGDSASSTEVYALLSALSDLPIRQGIAVTGSVDQKGDIQPVGGINEKIEGFYKICVIKGLTGDQGVIIPEANLRDLMLDDEVVSAVRKRRFHLYPVRTIEQGAEILMDRRAGEPDASGRYPEETIYGLVDARLRSYNELVRTYSGARPI